MTWNTNTNYAFPPFSLISIVLRKLEQDQGKLVLIAPLWSTQTWFAKMLKMICADSYLLPDKKQLLLSPMDPQKLHPIKNLKLGVFQLSGKSSDNWAYQNTLPKSLVPRGESRQQNNIGLISKDGCSFVVKGRIMHLNHLPY